MNCRTVQSLLSAYIDRESNPDETQEIRLHLAFCDTCRIEEREIRSLKSLISGIPAPEPDPNFEARLLLGIGQCPVRTYSGAGHLPRAVAAFVLFAVASMIGTMELLSWQKSVVLPQNSSPDFSAEVRRDQVYEADASEPLFGAPMITAADYAR